MKQSHSLRDSRGQIPETQTWSVRAQREHGSISNTEAESSEPEHKAKSRPAIESWEGISYISTAYG